MGPSSAKRLFFLRRGVVPQFYLMFLFIARAFFLTAPHPVFGDFGQRRDEAWPPTVIGDGSSRQVTSPEQTFSHLFLLVAGARGGFVISQTARAPVRDYAAEVVLKNCAAARDYAARTTVRYKGRK